MKKYAIITGANRGIGLATANIFLKNGYGVVGTGRSNFQPEHNDFHYYSCDVSNFDQCQKLFQQVRKDWGDGLIALVNNAGLGYSAPIDKLELNQWHEMINTNVNGVFYMTKLAVPLMKAQEAGHIFNLSSIAGKTGIETMGGYCASKFAVTGFTHSIYKELRPYGIKVSAIYPGSVNTAFFDAIPGVESNDSMMRAEDIAETIWNAFNTHPNFHILDIEMRPLKPKK